MRNIFTLIGFVLPFLIPVPVFAVSSDISTYTSNTLQIIYAISGLAASFFLIKGGYQYMTSSGNVEALMQAKQTIKHALFGLVIVLGAGILVSSLSQALTGPIQETTTTAITLEPVETKPPNSGVAQVIIDAMTGFLQNIIESAVSPLITAIYSFLASTPSVLSNSVIMKFWLIILAICNSLFVIVVALIGLGFMAAPTFGFEESRLSQLLPRLGITFLGMNTSLFLADYVIQTCNTLVKAVIDATGGEINRAWIESAINLQSLLDKSLPIILLIFLLIFEITCIVLLFMYITRLIAVAVGAVLSPFIFLLWALPKFSDYAEIAAKTYVVSVFTVFIHVVILQLATAFLALPDIKTSSLLSVAMAIGLFMSLIKVPSLLFNFVFYSTSNAIFKRGNSQLTNVLTNESPAGKEVKLPREKLPI